MCVCGIKGPGHRADSARRVSAFTLVELLVVVAIVGVLMAMLLPAVGKARLAARFRVSQSNMRQVGLAITAYTHDYKTVFPQPFADADIKVSATSTVAQNDAAQGSALWFNAIDPYLSRGKLAYQGSGASAAIHRHYETFKQDPSWAFIPEQSTAIHPVSHATVQVIRRDNRTFKMNENFGHRLPSGHVRWVREQMILRHDRTVLLGDGRAQDVIPHDLSTARNFYLSEATIGLRYNNGASIYFADGSVRHEICKITYSGAGYPGWYKHGDVDQPFIWEIK